MLGLLLGCVASMAACGTDPAGTAPSAPAGPVSSTSATATIAYRFERPPTVVFVSDSSAGDFWIFARMNRSLPRNAHGITATFTLDGGSRPFGTPATNSRRPPCYSTEISAGDNPKAPPNIVDPQDGQLVKVTLRFPGQDGTSTSVAARAVNRLAVGSDRANARYLRRLGCRPT